MSSSQYNIEATANDEPIASPDIGQTENQSGHAPGGPGITPRWTSSNKSSVGTSTSSQSRVWFTTSHGIVNEVYYPRVDEACTRDMGFIVADGAGYINEEKRDTTTEISAHEPGVPAIRIKTRCKSGFVELEKTIITDPRRDVLLQEVIFRPLKGKIENYRLYILLAPHLVNAGAHNTGWIDNYKGIDMLFASGKGTSLALACSQPWRARSVGYVGTSDGWQDIAKNGEMQWRYERAENGNIALTGEIDYIAGEKFTLALGFGRSPNEAALRARGSLLNGFDAARRDYVAGWRDWQQSLLKLDRPDAVSGLDPYRVSTAVIRSHEAKSFAGGIIASLAIPWGFSKGDDDLGGYHLVWPRDLVQTAGGLLACGAKDFACHVLLFLEATQEADGHWSQNMWLDGAPYWQGIQMDECAFPVLLVDLAMRNGAIQNSDVARFWPMVERAVTFILRFGPLTGQDRWEEYGGYSPYTLAVEIAALLIAADFAEVLKKTGEAAYLRDVADYWNSRIDSWCYAANTKLAQDLGIDGYYVRVTPGEMGASGSILDALVAIKNRSDENIPANQLISPDALALVRFGLRDANDPRIVNTVKAIDALLKVELPTGPCWRRYNGDGYGEHEDGSPFDGTGIGRLWPLLTGERAHYELAAGRAKDAHQLLETMESLTSSGKLLPEQVWDSDDIPERELYRGKPSGSAMPLVWAHAEHIKLLRSLRDDKVFDLPPQTYQRYVRQNIGSALEIWRFNSTLDQITAGKILRIEVFASVRIHWSDDRWQTIYDTNSGEPRLGVYWVDLPTERLNPGQQIVFTFYWPETQKWEGRDFAVNIVGDKN